MHVRRTYPYVMLGLMMGSVYMPGCSGDGEPSESTDFLAAGEPAPASRPATDTAPATQPAEPWFPPSPPASADFVNERHHMVETQIARPRDGRTPVTDKAVLEAMRSAPRHVFVPPERVGQAYFDHPLPIGHEQTISQPYIVALMTELMKITPESKVLEVGTGSGYQAAVLGQLTPHVYTVEIIAPLAEQAAGILREQGYTNVRVRRSDGFWGWPEEAPFDAIMVTFAPEELPEALWEQLKTGGRIVAPIGPARQTQHLMVITKTPEGKRETTHVIPVRFVPMLRD